MKYLWWFFLIVVLVVVIGFSILNAHLVLLDYFFGEVTLPLVIIILIAFIVGAVLGILVGYFRGRSNRKKKSASKS
ncbi:LapA family protein [Thiotrichales bacterium 19S3-7]|nr:LapA family protein [Thiotrichales bacterium 19S3-7]MCF6800568.1 LapA family protein [Thiotrichales bacterium 19S3-11]